MAAAEDSTSYANYSNSSKHSRQRSQPISPGWIYGKIKKKKSSCQKS